MAKILIVGLGDLGSRLAVTLHADGHEVHGLRRKPEAPQGITLWQADVAETADFAVPEQLDYAFVILTPGEMTGEAYHRTYVQGLSHVITALQNQSLKRLFFVSSTAVYGQEQGELVDEDSPSAPQKFNGAWVLEAELLLRTAPFAGTAVRFGGIYGPERLRLLKWVESGKSVQAEPASFSNRIHIDDCVGILRFLLNQNEAGVELEQTYNGVDDAPTPQHEVLDWVAQQLKVTPVPKDTVAGGLQNKRISNARIKALGYTFKYPSFKEGYTPIICEYLASKNA